jgi:DNA processing protein
MDTEELRAWLRLTHTEGVGPDTARRLLACFGSAPAVFSQSEAALRQVASVRQTQALLQTPPELPARLAQTQHWLDRSPHHHLWTLGNAAYPPALLDVPDPPLLLYAQGCGTTAPWRPNAPARPGIAIVGSRNPTHQGEQTARQMAHALASAGLCVVSGLALGIDGAAHQGALDSSDLLPGCLTIAVVGTGLDRVYPRQHQALSQRIAQHGLILSECPLGTPPLAANFPRRNRLIAALGQGTLVVEAALHSGSLITAQLALELGREVLAIPGSIHAPQSHGCHALIRQGAKLVEKAQDVLEELHLPQSGGLRLPHHTDKTLHANGHGNAQVDAQDGAQGDSDTADDALLSHMGFDPVGLDALQARTGLATSALQTELLTLELNGHIGRLPGGLFQRVR